MTKLTCCLVVLVLIASNAAYGGNDRPALDKPMMLESRPVLEPLQAQNISAEERATAYFYKDRIEYYSNELVKTIEKSAKLPATTDDGVLFTEIFLTQFKKHPGVYAVQRGWDKNGNCHVRSVQLRTKGRDLASIDDLLNKSDELIEGDGETNTCSGDPCSKCKPYDRDLGCRCEIGERCNHSVSTE